MFDHILSAACAIRYGTEDDTNNQEERNCGDRIVFSLLLKAVEMYGTITREMMNEWPQYTFRLFEAGYLEPMADGTFEPTVPNSQRPIRKTPDNEWEGAPMVPLIGGPLDGRWIKLEPKYESPLFDISPRRFRKGTSRIEYRFDASFAAFFAGVEREQLETPR